MDSNSIITSNAPIRPLFQLSTTAMNRFPPDAFPHDLIQIAGVHDMEEAEMLLHAGVDLIGIPLRLTVHQEDLSEAQAAGLSRKLPGKCCLITYLSEVDEICEFTRQLAVEFVQLHGPVDPEIMPQLRQRLPYVRFIKSLVIGKGSFSDLVISCRQFSPHVWAFITDTYDPATGAEGATGHTHDWSLSRQLVMSTRRPVILAGGLNASNVGDAVMTCRPGGVDVHTGVEGANGRKDPSMVAAFVKASRSAFKRLRA